MLVVDSRQLTIFAGIEVDHIANPDIDNPQESLILLLELLLVKHLDREYTILRSTPIASSAMNHPQPRPQPQQHAHLKRLIPVRVQRPLNHRRGIRLFAIERCDSEGVRESCTNKSVLPATKLSSGEGRRHTEHLALIQSISSNDYNPISNKPSHLAAQGSLTRHPDVGLPRAQLVITHDAPDALSSTYPGKLVSTPVLADMSARDTQTQRPLQL